MAQLEPFEDYYDENFVESLKVPTGDGPDNLSDYNLIRRGKRHDYFTSCLPWPQKGPGVEISIGGSATISGIAVGNGVPSFSAGSGSTAVGQIYTTSNISTDVSWSRSAGEIYPLSWRDPALKVTATADLSTATPISINDLRQAFPVTIQQSL